MKTLPLIITLLFVFILPATQIANGAPFAKTNNMVDITNWDFSVDSGPDQAIVPTAEGAGFVGYYDLATLSDTGAHTIKVRACNSWGCGPYSPDYPFITVAPGTPFITIVPVGP